MVCLDMKAIKLKESKGTFPKKLIFCGHALIRAEGYKNEGIHKGIVKQQPPKDIVAET